MSLIRTRVAEAILADVLEEVTRLGASVENLEMAEGVCVVSVRAEDARVPEFERWLAIFTKGASRVETIPK